MSHVTAMRRICLAKVGAKVKLLSWYKKTKSVKAGMVRRAEV